MDLCGVLSRSLSTREGERQPQSLHSLCIRTAAIYATTALYEFHDKQKALGNEGDMQQQQQQQQQQQLVHESAWEQVFPMLDQHFLRLVPGHRYEQFLDSVLQALEVAGHFDQTGRQLMQYIVLFFPRHIRCFRVARRYDDRVLMPTVCCLHKCTNMEELYLEKADSHGITTYLLAHVLKFVNRLKVLSLPAQSDDDVLSTVGINCPKLESIVLTDTNVTNSGLAWLLCCRKLHTVILPGISHTGITPKGVALLLNGLPSLRHLVCDLISEVLAYIDFNTSELVQPRFELKTILFHSVELLSSNHLELVTKLCPKVEWLSLDSALFYNLEGLGHFPHLNLLRLNYKGRPLDQTVLDFFALNGSGLTKVHFFNVKDLHLDDLCMTVGSCANLETLILYECSIRPDWDKAKSYEGITPLGKTVEHLQLVSLQVLPWQLLDFLLLFSNLRTLDMDSSSLDAGQSRRLLGHCTDLSVLRCPRWTRTSSLELASLQAAFKRCKLLVNRRSFCSQEDEDWRQTLTSRLLSEYVDFSVTLNLETFASTSASP